MTVLELYRGGSITGAKAAELVGMPRVESVRYASCVGIGVTSDDQEADIGTFDA